jgi:trans-2-enoyl-CoA reductase
LILIELLKGEREEMATAPKKVTIIGSGNWGSAIARNVGANAKVFRVFFLHFLESLKSSQV